MEYCVFPRGEKYSVRRTSEKTEDFSDPLSAPQQERNVDKYAFRKKDRRAAALQKGEVDAKDKKGAVLLHKAAGA